MVEKDKTRCNAAEGGGAILGGIAGAGVGFAIGGPLGALIGALIGELGGGLGAYGTADACSEKDPKDDSGGGGGSGGSNGGGSSRASARTSLGRLSWGLVAVGAILTTADGLGDRSHDLTPTQTGGAIIWASGVSLQNYVGFEAIRAQIAARPCIERGTN